MEVKIYKNERGDEPFIIWLDAIKDTYTRLRISKRLRRIEQNNLGDVGSVGDGVYELRIHFGPGFRVYFGYIGKEVILLLIGGDKGSQVRDMQKAKFFWQDYKRSIIL
ncbi:addiction module killer protein [bacterium]|jgi:putative addiction module killer protein|nr:addiction module killer protein [bacterium]MDP6571282.1 type II toxin-antitoxin system RelE/ParE family toxin [Patescibacteria group bacterium]MDP6756122.1 type II toxin-antitoxin system RelE/ParE family toxin [Patescibacteria group bacterium]|tara:strand:- start:18258 stop:18581 length:324 start_codon:yes stop_codon:yes gene_type:complete